MSTTRDDDTIDLGSVDEIETGETLALRDLAEELEPEDEPEAPRSGSRIKQGIDQLRSYRDIAHTPYGSTPVIVLAFVYLAQVLDGRAFIIAGPTLAADLELNLFTIFGIFSIVSLFDILGRVGAGYISERGNHRLKWVGFGLIASGLFSMLSARATGFGSLSTTRSASNVGGSASDITRTALLADYYPVDMRGRVFAATTTMSSLSTVMSLVVVGTLIRFIGWRSTFLVLGGFVVLAGILVLTFLTEPIRGYMERRSLGANADVASREGELPSFGETWRSILGIRTVRRIMLANLVTDMGDTLQLLVLPFFFAEVYKLDAFELSLAYLPGFLTGIVGAMLGGAFVDRLIKRDPSRTIRLVALATAVTTFSAIVLFLRPPLWVVLATNAIIGTGTAFVKPGYATVYASVLPPRVRTAGYQISNLAALPPQVFAAVMGLTILGEYGYRGVFITAAAFAVIGAIVQLTAAPFFDLDRRSMLAGTMADEEWRRAKASGRAKMLVCRDIEVEYSGVKVLFGVDFDVEQGEIVALLGTNGAGKSTLLRAISGTTQASSGAVVFDGRDISAMPPHEVAARGVVFMPGGRGVFPEMTVRENVMLGGYMISDPAELDARLEDIYELFPVLRERAETRAGSLSGGEQQQLSLAQAFLCKPRLLLIDELSLGLSPAVVAELLDIVRKIRDQGVTVVVVEQSVNVALALADRAVFMEKGEVKFVGPTAELLERPDILRAVYVKGAGALTDGTPAAARHREGQARLAELADSRPILEVEGLVKRYGGVVAVEGATFDLREGGVLGLIGPNGAGKTTIFDLISGYQEPDEGVIRFDGVDITNMSAEERAKRKLVRRFQDARLFPSLTVFETLLVSLEQRIEVRSAVMNALALPQARASERRARLRAERLVELLELGAYRDKFVKELSTGLRRIVDLACVLAAEPQLLLLDEPSTGIAQAEAESLGPLLRRVRFETGCSILIIEHDMPLISAVSDELVALERGRVVARGLPADVLNDERVVRSYLGDTDVTVKRSGALA